MALDKKHWITRKWINEGYKVFIKTADGDIRVPYQFLQININVWLKDLRIGSIWSCNWFNGWFYYPKGFHFFFKEKDALLHALEWNNEHFRSSEKAVVKKVLIRDMVASGVQFNSKVGVAKEMFVVD